VDLYSVATQIGAALATVTPALRVYPYGTVKIEAPAAVFALPDSLDYHQSYGTGAEKISDAAVLVMLRDHTRRTSFKTLSDYVKPTGSTSVKAALETYAYTTCDNVTVTRVDFDIIGMGGADYLSALFHLDIFGTGA
jgi:hypothetical protein